MNTLQVLLTIMRVGYLNKVRTYRFLIILIFTIILGYIFVPPLEADYVTLAWVSLSALYRGVYNSAWIGSMVSLLTGAFLTLFGFYVVNDTVKQDEKTRVGEIIATTPVKNSVYTLGNTLCNFVVLSTMVIIVVLTSIGMQVLRGECFTINIGTLLSPFIVLVLPLMFLVSAIAIFFESRTFLRGSIGNIVYAFSWLFGLPLFSELFDLFGIKRVLTSMGTAGQATYPELALGQSILGLEWGFTHNRTLTTFVWNGINWTSEFFLIRILLIGVALCISLIASVGFNRFDSAFETSEHSIITFNDNLNESELCIPSTTLLKEIKFETLEAESLQFGFITVLTAELKLCFKEYTQLHFPGIWMIATSLLLIVSGFVIPLDAARSILLPIAWIIPLPFWSKMGIRENQHRTNQLVFSSAYSLKHQFVAMWITGVVLTVITGSGVALNMALHSDFPSILAWLVGAIFIPSLALCIGVWTGSNKLFELIYILLWYIGPFNKVRILDFMGVLRSSVVSNIWQTYLVISVILFGLAFIGRKWQIQRG